MHSNRRKKQPKKVRQNPRRQDPRSAGFQAFHTSDFAGAIQAWCRLNPADEPRLASMLAEAHFRQALSEKDRNRRMQCLARASELLPSEPRFWYHLGLTHHAGGSLAEARTAYSRAAETGCTRSGFGYLRGLTALELNPEVDLDSLPWLSAEDRQSLEPIAALLAGHGDKVPSGATGRWVDLFKGKVGVNPRFSLWSGLALLQRGQPEPAAEALALGQGVTLPGDAEWVRLFYYGLALAAGGHLESAIEEWNSSLARHPSEHNRSHLRKAYLQKAKALLQAGNASQALEAVQTVQKHLGESNAFARVAAVACQRLAQEAAQSNDWKSAVNHWGEVLFLLSSSPFLGPSAPILHNLALANEKLEQWEAAAQHWASLLQPFPKPASKVASRRSSPQRALPLASGASADDPAKVAESLARRRNWVQNRTIECFRRAGRPDLALPHLRRAARENPKDLSLQIALSKSLQDNEQGSAARKKLQQVVKKDPQNEVARLSLAEMHLSAGRLEAAEKTLQGLLDEHPESREARQGMSKVLQHRAEEDMSSGRNAAARRRLQRALELSPGNPDLLIHLGDSYLFQNRKAQAKPLFEKALSSRQPVHFLNVFHSWACANNLKEAQAVLDRAEAEGIATAHVCVNLAEICLEVAGSQDEMPPEPPRRKPRRRAIASSVRWEELAERLIERGYNGGQCEVDVLKNIVSMLINVRVELAFDYAEELARRQPDEPESLSLYGFMQAMQGRHKSSRQTLRRALNLAKKQGNDEMVGVISESIEQIEDPIFQFMTGGSLSFIDEIIPKKRSRRRR